MSLSISAPCSHDSSDYISRLCVYYRGSYSFWDICWNSTDITLMLWVFLLRYMDVLWLCFYDEPEKNILVERQLQRYARVIGNSLIMKIALNSTTFLEASTEVHTHVWVECGWGFDLIGILYNSTTFVYPECELWSQYSICAYVT